jgi:hypothetical protein
MPLPDPANNLAPFLTDCYHRSPAWLLSSLACHAQWLLRENLFSKFGVTQQYLQTLINLHEQRFLPEDAIFLFEEEKKENNHIRPKRSFLLGIDWSDMPLQELLAVLPDLRQIYQLVVLHFDSQTSQWAVFRVSFIGNVIEAYTFGKFNSENVLPTAQKLATILQKKGPKAKYGFTCQLEIPLTFAKNIGFASYCFAFLMHRDRDYLDLDDKIMIQKVLTYYAKFKLKHDKWLGKFCLHKATPATHPFLTIFSDEKYDDELDDIMDNGWCPIDVEGDGNCGYYSTILGFENNSNYTLSPTPYQIDEQNTNMLTSIPWQEKTMELRQSLKQHATTLVTTTYRSEANQPEWFWQIGAYSQEVVPSLPHSFVCPRLKMRNYFVPAFKNKSAYHMHPYWAALVIASKFQIRVIVIARMSGKQASWSTTIFAYNAKAGSNDNIIHEQVDYIKRISDTEFKAQSTIELLYLGGYQESDTKHFLFLRRVIRSDTARPPERASDNLGILLGYRKATVPTNYSLTDRETDEKDELHDATKHDDTKSIGKDDDDDEDDDDANQDDELPGKDSEGCDDSADRDGSDDNAELCHDYSNDDLFRDSSDDDDKLVHNVDDMPDFKEQPQNVDQPSANLPVLPNDDKDESMQNPNGDNDELVQNDVDTPTVNLGNVSQMIKRKRRKVVRKKFTKKVRKKVESLTQSSSSNERTKQPRLKYDDTFHIFYTCFYNPNTKKFTKVTEERDVDWIQLQYVKDAKENPNVWVGPPIGDPFDRIPPDEIRTNVRTLFEQLNKPYCLTYSLASCLYYCGFDWQARILASQAMHFSKLHFDRALLDLKNFMENLCPLIGRPTLFGRRTKRHGKLRRELSWEMLFEDFVPYPTLIIPVMPDGSMSHAFCVVDDLIFDSITKYTLKLRKDAVEWIFNGANVDIYEAWRYNMKCSPEGRKVEGRYKRPVKINW